MSAAKAVHRLMRNIGSLTDGQGSIEGIDWDKGEVYSFKVVIRPNSGLFQGGRFEFEIDVEDNYPCIRAPIVRCLTDIYHPNFSICDESSPTDVCINLLDKGIWNPAFGLESIVLGIIFLFHHPNLDAAVCDLFYESQVDQKTFEENVRLYMRGEEVDGYYFDAQFFSNIDGEPITQQASDKKDTMQRQSDFEGANTIIASEKDSDTASASSERGLTEQSEDVSMTLVDVDGETGNALVCNY